MSEPLTVTAENVNMATDTPYWVCYPHNTYECLYVGRGPTATTRNTPAATAHALASARVAAVVEQHLWGYAHNQPDTLPNTFDKLLQVIDANWYPIHPDVAAALLAAYRDADFSEAKRIGQLICGYVREEEDDTCSPPEDCEQPGLSDAVRALCGPIGADTAYVRIIERASEQPGLLGAVERAAREFAMGMPDAQYIGCDAPYVAAWVASAPPCDTLIHAAMDIIVDVCRATADTARDVCGIHAAAECVYHAHHDAMVAASDRGDADNWDIVYRELILRAVDAWYNEIHRSEGLFACPSLHDPIQADTWVAEYATYKACRQRMIDMGLVHAVAEHVRHINVAVWARTHVADPRMSHEDIRMHLAPLLDKMAVVGWTLSDNDDDDTGLPTPDQFNAGLAHLIDHTRYASDNMPDAPCGRASYDALLRAAEDAFEEEDAPEYGVVKWLASTLIWPYIATLLAVDESVASSL